MSVSIRSAVERNTGVSAGRIRRMGIANGCAPRTHRMLTAFTAPTVSWLYRHIARRRTASQSRRTGRRIAGFSYTCGNEVNPTCRGQHAGCSMLAT
eukprot:scaffold151375_cov36-Tisochrysis_lutea.AAC.2